VRKVHFDLNADKNSARIIEMIAADTHLPFAEVKRVYDDEYARLKSEAHVYDYLVLFATRRTREALARIH
jgi:hypothetical protein